MPVKKSSPQKSILLRGLTPERAGQWVTISTALNLSVNGFAATSTALIADLLESFGLPLRGPALAALNLEPNESRIAIRLAAILLRVALGDPTVERDATWEQAVAILERARAVLTAQEADVLRDQLAACQRENEEIRQSRDDLAGEVLDLSRSLLAHMKEAEKGRKS